MSYADGKQVAYVLLIGEEEIASGQYSLKNMQSGEQHKVTKEQLVDFLSDMSL